MLSPEEFDDPAGIGDSALRHAGLDAEAECSSASLEDVFVAVTLKPRKAAA